MIRVAQTSTIDLTPSFPFFPPLKTDSLFYEIFQLDPTIVFELIDRTAATTALYSFASQEVKQTSFRIDGILLPPLHAVELPIVFVEVQGYKDQKGTLYSSFFSQIFLYLHDYQPRNDWCAVLIFTKRSLDPGLPRQYQDFAQSDRFYRAYLDQIEWTTERSIGLGLLQLVGVRPQDAADRARALLDRTRLETGDSDRQRKFVELVETVLVYKFPELSREEIERMLGLNELRQTRVYQEALEEGRQEGRQEGKVAVVPLLLKAGLSIEQIAEQLELSLEAVQQAAEQP